MGRVAIYARVSTGEQTTANQAAELTAWAERCGHTVIRVYEGKGISGSKGRDKRPSFDAMLKAAVRREFDMLAVWSSDRLGRSLQHLIEVLQTIRETGIGLYIHTQALDTTTRGGASDVRDAGRIRRVRARDDRGSCQRRACPCALIRHQERQGHRTAEGG